MTLFINIRDYNPKTITLQQMYGSFLSSTDYIVSYTAAQIDTRLS